MLHRLGLKVGNMCLAKGAYEVFVTKTDISSKGIAKGINI